LLDAHGTGLQRKMVALAWTWRIDQQGRLDLARLAAERHDAVGKIDSVVDVMRHEDDGLLISGPYPNQLVLQGLTRQGVERLKGSSISMIAGSTASARASATRCLWAPDN